MENDLPNNSEETTKRSLTREDFLRAAEASADLLDEEVMAGACR